MEDLQGQDPNNSPSHGSERSNEPVRSRWTPKPEQILILESIFNSGMVNPPKDETVRIRKLLEKFGSVGDANVFYWFQNRRSRSRRRQRQMQAGLAAASGSSSQGSSGSAPGVEAGPSMGGGSSSSCGALGNDGGDDFFSFSGQVGLSGIHESPSSLCPSDSSNLEYQSGYITVFINGVPTQVPRGPIDMKVMFGEDVVLVHSSGVPVPFNDYGFSAYGLHHGESYFLVSRTT